MENKKETKAKLNTENNFTKEVKNQKRRKPRQAVSKNITVKAEKKEDFKFKKENLKIIPLGGLHEIGKNITVFEYGNDIVLVDCGVAFPEDEMLGIDLVIPDFTYLVKNKEKIRGLVVTHGHEDHIGSIPYLLKEINIPIYATKLTAGLIENKLEEHKLKESTKLNIVKQGQTIVLGKMRVEFNLVDHFIFSQRLTFLSDENYLFKNASTYQKVFGRGYLNQGEETKLIEMDYFDVFYHHGIIGFIIFFIIYGIVVIKTLNKKKKTDFNQIMLYTSFLLILTLSLFSGHIIIAPSVNIIVISLILKL